jgi:hypothetical protein
MINTKGSRGRPLVVDFRSSTTGTDGRFLVSDPGDTVTSIIEE